VADERLLGALAFEPQPLGAVFAELLGREKGLFSPIRGCLEGLM
jgi:hypothetical protein